MNIIDKLKIAQSELKARMSDFEDGSENRHFINESIEKLGFLIQNPKLLGEIKESEIVHIENYDDEIWEPVTIVDNRMYEVSNRMRVKNVQTNNILNLCLHNGYNNVTLKKNGRFCHFRLCRVVADAFIPNPDNKPNVDHINSNSLDDRLENLRWTTQKENMNNKETTKKMRGVKGEPVLQYTKYGDFVKEYDSPYAAALENGWPSSSGIRHCCNKEPKYKMYRKFIWKYKKDVPPSKRYKKQEDVDYYTINGNSIPIVQLSLNGEFIREWNSAEHAMRELGITCIDRCCNGKYKQACGYIWRYKKDVPKKLLHSKPQNIEYHKIVKVPRAIVQLSLDGKIVKEWPYIGIVSKELNYPYSGIRNCCLGKIPEYRGFIWKYKDSPQI